MKIRRKDKLMQNEMAEKLHLSELIQKYISPLFKNIQMTAGLPDVKSFSGVASPNY